MSSDRATAIRCEGVSKQYLLDEGLVVVTLAERLGLGLRSLVGAGRPRRRRRIWALKDVSLDLPAGTILGLVGRNGAGKSTLLKILSRITCPTEGRFMYNGTIASILEVGMGFKEELTGRDNIFLNGSIMGLKRRQIQAKFDEIVAFAEIEDFVDTPVKRYSSGMYVRLAFAIAAHLDSDILLIDEVLAVGDQRFQKKSLQQMGEVARRGRTVIFVSHNLEAVTQLCRDAVLIEDGRVAAMGPAREVVATYQERNRTEGERLAVVSYEAPPNCQAFINRIVLRGGKDPSPRLHMDIMEPVRFEVHYTVLSDMTDLKVALHVNTLGGVTIFSSFSLDWRNFKEGTRVTLSPREAGNYVAEGCIEAPLLNAGCYELVFSLCRNHEIIFNRRKGLLIEITDNDASFASCVSRSRAVGTVVRPVEWEERRDG